VILGGDHDLIHARPRGDTRRGLAPCPGPIVRAGVRDVERVDHPATRDAGVKSLEEARIGSPRKAVASIGLVVRHVVRRERRDARPVAWIEVGIRSRDLGEMPTGSGTDVTRPVDPRAGASRRSDPLLDGPPLAGVDGGVDVLVPRARTPDTPIP